MASNAVSYGGDDGSEFVGQMPPSPAQTPLSLHYEIDRVLADGPLFLPTTMEHKWALFHHQEQLLFVRSWQRRVLVGAATRLHNGYVEAIQAQGSFADDADNPEFTSACLDFLIRSHALRLAFPAPLERDPGSDLRSAAQSTFSLFGNLAFFATHHRFTAPPPERPLRSCSLFHIAIAKGDVNGAQAQLDAGIPVDLLAGDGLSAMHWALASNNVDTLSWLVERGLAVDTVSDEGATTLMNAVQDDNIQGAKWLLDHGADADARDARGFTSLHRAAEMGREPMVGLLIAYGATPDPVAEGHTPLLLATARGHERIVAMLRAK